MELREKDSVAHIEEKSDEVCDVINFDFFMVIIFTTRKKELSLRYSLFLHPNLKEVHYAMGKRSQEQKY